MFYATFAQLNADHIRNGGEAVKRAERYRRAALASRRNSSGRTSRLRVFATRGRRAPNLARARAAPETRAC